ncbi:MAG: gamma-glutamyl-gamma-aminobutyrate hydrolase family protein [Pseudomonadales bacterium]|nr:gamma-glutamyl-gamma-aminobutyrate hydrolase family protein [Pseudomonadales bacterium]
MLRPSDRPLIAITGANIILDKDERAPISGVRKAYLDLVINAGGIPVLISNTTDLEVLAAIVKKFDGLLLTGGGDIHPSRYKAYPKKESGKNGHTFDPNRDVAEMFLAQAFIKDGKAVLGICRGLQMINVASGGTLKQHVEGHFNPKENDYWYNKIHPVLFLNDTYLRRLAQNESSADIIRVNSQHHQAIDKVGSGLKIAGINPEDNVIEAMEGLQMPEKFLLGVQWHPELFPEDPITKAILNLFVKSATDQKKQ